MATLKVVFFAMYRRVGRYMVYTETLKKNYEFKNVLSKGKYYSGKCVDIYIQKNKKQINVIGIAVGTKVAKAAKRNRIKRLIRENYRLIENELKVGNNILFLWKKKSSIENATFNNIKKDIQNIFKYAEIYK